MGSSVPVLVLVGEWSVLKEVVMKRRKINPFMKI